MKRKRLYALRLAIVLLIALPIIIGSRTPDHVSEAQTGGIPIVYGANVYGSIAAGAPSPTYVFSGAAGDLAIADVVPLTAGFVPSLDLAAPDGQVLASAQPDRMGRHEKNARLAQFLAQQGTYTLTVSGRNGTAGNYMLRLNGRAAVVGTPLQYGVPVDVTIPENAASQFFTFVAETCPTTLVVTNGAAGDPFTFPFAVRVRDEQGQTIALLRGGDAQEDQITVAPMSGRYEVEVLSDDPAVAGVITLLVTCSGDAPGCAGSGEGTELVCLPCPSCPEDFEDDTIPVCPVMNLTIDTEGAGITLRWNAVPDTDHYWIHMYGFGEEGEVYLGAAGVPGDATEFTIGHLFEGFSGFRFVIEAIQDDTPICTDETEILRAMPVCPEMNLTLEPEGEGYILRWNAVPGTDHYLIHIYGLSDDGETYFGAAGAPGDATEFALDHLPEGFSGFRFVIEAIRGDTPVCTDETMILRVEPIAPCAIRTDREDVRVHVGPGRHRGVFAFLPAGEDILVIGQARDDEGNLWWQIDKTRIPGHEAVISLWVMASDVMASGNCDDVPEGDIPPVVPDEPDHPPGGWGQCGSCDTCGHPGECVISPDGACVWDPATCADEGGTCLTIRATVDASACPNATASAMIDTAPNCDGSGYLPGTTINAHAVADNPKCTVDFWSGCGASGSGSTVTFTATSSCTLTAHMSY